MVACPHRCVEFVTPAPRMRGFVLIAYGLAHRYHRIIPPQLSGPRTGVGAVGNLPRGFVRLGLSVGPRPPCGGRFFVVCACYRGASPAAIKAEPCVRRAQTVAYLHPWCDDGAQRLCIRIGAGCVASVWRNAASVAMWNVRICPLAPRMRGFVFIAYGLAHRYRRIIPPIIRPPHGGRGRR